jgi:ketosteroid isomerase-like protein
MFAALQRGDLDDGFKYAVPDFEFDNRTEAPGAAGVWRGRDGFRTMMGRVTEAFSDYAADVLDSHERGDEVTLKLRERSRGRTSGMPMEREIFLTYSFRDGRVERMTATLEPPV